MSALRFFNLVGTSIFRRHSAAPLRPLHLPIPILGFQRHCTSAVASEFPVSTESSGNNRNHPWPEWISFVDCLKTKGYFAETASDGDAASEGNDREPAYTDFNVLKNACLSFGRDRFYILDLLSTEEMQAVVGKGCPTLFRKAVNSAKRLRAHLQIDEGNACGACNLRGSCDKAYVVLNESDGDARTVDIMRLLLYYALDTLVTSGGEKPPGRELIEASVRKLLLELIELSETPIDPKLERPTPKAIPEKINVQKKFGKDDIKLQKGDWICSQCDFMNFNRNMQCLKCRAKPPKGVYVCERASRIDIEKKKGDWMCSRCNFMNFNRNMECLKCRAKPPEGADVPVRALGNDIVMKKGDWICSQCNFMNFSRNFQCLKCGTKSSERANAPEGAPDSDTFMKKGDWKCTSCNFVNFASRSSCKTCNSPRGKRQLNPGEWECTSCDYVNFRRNMVCKKCNQERPRDLQTEKRYEEQLWRKPSFVVE